MAATLSSRGIASGRTAAALWNIPGFVIRENEIEVLVRAGKRFPRWSGVKVHRTKFLPDEDVHLVSGIPVTSPARTILMLGASESPSVVRRAAIHCLQNHLVTPEQLKHQLQIMGRCGLDGTAALRRVVAALTFDQELTDSDLEDAAEELLRKEGYPQPLLHFRYVEEGVLLGEIDLYWRELSLGIEADSWAFHSGRPEFQRDRGKQNSLVAAGVTILRFTPEDARRPRRFLTAFERTWERLSALCAR